MSTEPPHGSSGRIGVNRVWVVAGHAVLDVETRFAMHFEIVVAGVASVVVDDQAMVVGIDGTTGRQEIVGRVVGRDVFGQESVASVRISTPRRCILVSL